MQVRNEDGRVEIRREGLWWCVKGFTGLHEVKWEARQEAIYPNRVLGTALAACREANAIALQTVHARVPCKHE